MTIKFSKEQIDKLKTKIKSEIITELDSRKMRLDNSDVDYIVGKVQSQIVVKEPKLDSEKILTGLIKQVVLSEEEKKLAFNKEKILTKEVRADFINDILDKIPLPKDGDKGEKGKPGKKGENYTLTDQDRTDISKGVDLKGLMKEDVFNKRTAQLIKDIQSGKIKLPAHSGISGPEMVKRVNETVNENVPLLNYLYEETREGDEGINCVGEFHVGKHDDGKESVFGQGDSHTEGMVVLSSVDGVVFVDNSEIAASSENSTYQPFNGGLSIGGVDYVGSDAALCGIKLKTAVVLGIGSGDIVREYWDGSGWFEFTEMATDADPPYEQRANLGGQFVGSEQVRFGNCDNQVKTTVNGIEKFWVRFRVISAIVSTGEVEQIKLHTNRFEVGEDGFTEYFGDGIYIKDLLMHWGLTEELTGFSPQNQTITFASGISLSYLANKLNNGQTSGRGGIIEIPEGMDTSRSLFGEIWMIPLDNTGGDVLVQIDTYQTKEGDTLTVANTPDTITDTITIAPNTANQLYKSLAPVDVQSLVPGEILAFGFKRVGADVLDTYTGAIAIINLRAFGSFWKP